MLGKRAVYGVIVIIVILVGAGLFWYSNKPSSKTVSTFEECASAGYPILEIYPRQCITREGKMFVEDIGNELEKADLIRINTPRPNQAITSPLMIEGEARGRWFFEGNFPVRLLDENANAIGTSVARAEGEWMTEDFVPFQAEIKFSVPSTNRGTLILEKDNPSGLPENADELRIPVTFPRSP